MSERPDKWITEQGREADVERTRSHFAALRACLKRGEEVSYELQRRIAALEADRDRLANEAFAALRQLDGYVDTLDYDPEDADEDDVTPADARALAGRHILRAALNEQSEGG